MQQQNLEIGIAESVQQETIILMFGYQVGATNDGLEIFILVSLVADHGFRSSAMQHCLATFTTATMPRVLVDTTTDWVELS